MPEIAVAFASSNKQRTDCFFKLGKFMMLTNAVGPDPTILSYSTHFKWHFLHAGFRDLTQWPEWVPQ